MSTSRTDEYELKLLKTKRVHVFKSFESHDKAAEGLQNLQRPPALRTVLIVRKRITKSNQVLKCRK